MRSARVIHCTFYFSFLKEVSILRFDRSVTTVYDGTKKITLISLMIPLLMQRIFVQLYGTANVILLSGFSEIAVSASSVANQVHDISTVLLSMITTGTVILSSIEIGAGNHRRAASFAGTGSIATFLVGCILALINFTFAEKFLYAMNLRGETLELACQYFKVRALFLPTAGLLNFFSQMLICNGYSKYTLAVGVFSNLLNFGLSYAALYAGFEFMSPISRVGLAAETAQILGIIAAVLLFRYKKCPYAFNFEFRKIFKILKLGIPGAMVSLMFRIAQTVTTGFVALMGDDVINTKVFIGNVVAYVPLLGLAIGSSNMVFMGRFKGAGDLEKANICHRQNRAIAVTCNIVLSLLVFAFHRPLMMLFTSNEAIIDAAGLIFFLDLFVQIPRAINNVSESSLCANGDVKTTFFTSTLSCWLGSVALSYVLCVVFNMGLVGLWIAFAVDESIKAIIYIFRWRSGKWKNIKV